MKVHKSKGEGAHVAESTIMDAVIDGLKLGPCGEYLDRRRPKSKKQLFNIMQEYCKFDSGRQRRIDEYNARKKVDKSKQNWQPQQWNEQRSHVPVAKSNF